MHIFHKLGKRIKKALLQFGGNLRHGSVVDIAILISGVALVVTR